MAKKITTADLKIKSLIYRALKDEIKAYPIFSVELMSNGMLKIKSDHYLEFVVDEKSKLTELTDKYGLVWFLNISDAKEEQKKIRQEHLEKLQNDVSVAISKYNEAISIYTNIK